MVHAAPLGWCRQGQGGTRPSRSWSSLHLRFSARPCPTKRLLSKDERSMLWDSREQTGPPLRETSGGQARPLWPASERWSSVFMSEGQRLLVPPPWRTGPCRRAGPAQAQLGNSSLPRAGLPGDLSRLSWDKLPLLCLTLQKPVFLGEEPEGWQRGRTQARLRGPCYLPWPDGWQA